MKEINYYEMKQVKGGVALSISSALNAISKAVNTVFSIGQTVGSAIRRGFGGRMCNY